MTRHFLTACLVLILAAVALEAKCADVAKPGAIYLSLSAADLGSTAMALHAPGVSEGNGVMRSHAIEKQLAIAGLLTFVDVKLQKRHPKGVKAMRAAVIVIRVLAIGINLRNARER